MNSAFVLGQTPYANRTASHFHAQRQDWILRMVLTSIALAITVSVPLFLIGLQVSQCVALSVLIGLIGHRLVEVCRRDDDLFQPLNLVTLYFLIYFVVRAIDLILDPAAHHIGLLYYDDYVPVALWCASAGYVSLVLGARSGLPTKLTRLVPKPNPGWFSRPPIARILVLLTIGCGCWFYLLTKGAFVVGNHDEAVLMNKFSPMAGWIVLLASLLDLTFVTLFACVVVTRTSLGRMAASIMLGVSIVLIIVRFSYTGSKATMLEPVVECMIIYHYARKRLLVRQVAVLAAPVLLLSFGVLNIYRFVIIGEAGGAPQSFEEVFQRVSYAIDYFSSGRADNVGEAAWQTLLDRNAGVDALALVIKYTPERHAFDYGLPYLQIPLQTFVPRQLWPDKPINYFTGEFEDAYVAGWSGGFTSPHVISNLYQNLHVFGVIAGMFLIGVTLQWVYEAFAPFSKGLRGAFLYAALMPGVVHAFEWEPVSFCAYYIRYGLLLLFVTWFLGPIGLARAASTYKVR